jgi:hypothetical protein
MLKAEDDQCRDEMTWGFMGYGESGRGLVGRIKGLFLILRFAIVSTFLTFSYFTISREAWHLKGWTNCYCF